MKNLLLFCLIAFQIGCATGGKIGERPFALGITATQGGQEAHATVFLIPEEDWLVIRNSLDSPKTRQTLEKKYRVTEGKTPVTTYAPAYAFRVIVESNGKLIHARTPVVPGTDAKVNVAIDHE